jgi:hypothetical protein
MTERTVPMNGPDANQVLVRADPISRRAWIKRTRLAP